MGNDADWDKLRTQLNNALLFAADDVVKKILNFNKKFTAARTLSASKDFQMAAKDIQPLLMALRKELGLKSKSIKQEGLIFFQKP